MLVPNSFELWQKDNFFSAAEEVQQSADLMESTHRTWLRARKDGLMAPRHLDELRRELQMALGTAKWQLEEFERAVRLSYKIHRDDITVGRHTQFVSAIKDQIFRVETSFKESFNQSGENPFRWVNLDEQERDDLALFLSGTYGTPQIPSTEKNNTRLAETNQETRLPEIVPINEDTSEEGSKRDGVSYHVDQMANSRRMRNSPKKGILEIVINGDNQEGTALIVGTSKEKSSRPLFWSLRGEGCPGAKGVASSLTQPGMMDWITRIHRFGGAPLEELRKKHGVDLKLYIFLGVEFLVLTYFATQTKLVRSSKNGNRAVPNRV